MADYDMQDNTAPSHLRHRFASSVFVSAICLERS